MPAVVSNCQFTNLALEMDQNFSSLSVRTPDGEQIDLIKELKTLKDKMETLEKENVRLRQIMQASQQIDNIKLGSEIGPLEVE